MSTRNGAEEAKTKQEIKKQLHTLNEIYIYVRMKYIISVNSKILSKIINSKINLNNKQE